MVISLFSYIIFWKASSGDEDNEYNPTKLKRKGSQQQKKTNLTVNLLFSNNNKVSTTKADSNDTINDNLYNINQQFDNMQLDAQRVYSPQLKSKYKQYRFQTLPESNYNCELKLHQVPTLQSAPISAKSKKLKLPQPYQQYQCNPYYQNDQLAISFQQNQQVPLPNLMNIQQLQSDPTHFYDYLPIQTNFIYQAEQFDEIMLLEGDLILKCKDQQSARKIQKVFQTGDLEKRQLIFSRLEKGSLILSKDVFGNYVVQNLLEFGTKQQRMKLMSSILPSIMLLSFHNYGCRVVQKALEIFHNEETKEFQYIIDQVKQRIRELVVDPNGNHVVQKIIQLMDKEVADWVGEGVRGQVQRLTQNSFGCRIIQKLISISKYEQIKSILEEVMVISHELCFSQFGNYIIQQLLQDAPEHIKLKIQEIITSNFEELSLNKFGSNVVDQAVKLSDNKFKRKIMSILLRFNRTGNEQNQRIQFNPQKGYCFSRYPKVHLVIMQSRTSSSKWIIHCRMNSTRSQLMIPNYQKIYRRLSLVKKQHQNMIRNICLLNTCKEIRLLKF